MRVIRTFSFHLCISTVLAVYDSQSMRIIHAPDTLSDKSNFGFSITYFNKQLFISAPTADNIGKIFSYNIINKSINEIGFKLKRESANYTNDYWLGAYLTSGSNYVVTCAPRTIYKYVKQVTKGVCYKFSSSDDIVQLSDMELLERKPLNGGVDSFGWTIDINNQTNIIAVGGQGVGPGGVEIYENHLTSPRMLITDSPNFGYSIASGNFLSDEEIIYAISTPYGEHGEGQVYFYDKSLKKIILLDSGETGSMYGAVLCAAHLGHTRTSLLVGAPTFATNGRYNTGAVYIYVPAEKAKLLSSTPQLIRILKGTVDGGYFGAAIVSLGDIDGDGRDEVAIGAPYDGEGTVYVYSGFSLLNDRTWLQKIQPEKFKSFGFSLAPIPDVDGTKCNGLGVGAPLSNNAFIMKCIPIITVKLDAEFPNIQKKTNDEEYYKFKACLNVSYPLDPIKIRSEMEIKIEVIHAAAKLVNDSNEDLETYIFNLEERFPRICKEFNVLMFNGNYDELIKFNITAKLNSFKSTIFSAPELILSDLSVLTLQKSICVADCKSSCPCVPKLSAVTVQTTLTNPYKVGLQTLERFALLVQNSGETAYDACVVISVSNAFVQNISPSCIRYKSTRKFLCRPSQNIPPGIIWPVGDIQIDTSALTNKDDNLGIQYDIYDHCENETEKHTEKLFYPLIFDYDVFHISGASNPNKVLNITEDDVGSVKKIQHVYTISNKGYIDFYDVFIRIKLQRKSYINYQTPVLKLIRENETLSTECSHKVMTVKGFTNMMCSFDLLKASEALLFLSIDVIPNNLDEIENNATVLSEVHLLLSEKRLIARVETNLMVLSIAVPNWIWVVAFLTALIILFIVVLILRRCGYFKRQNKKKLQTLRKSRRIQTEMRYINKNHAPEQNSSEVNEKQEELAT